MKKVSVIIPAYNEAENIVRTLQGLSLIPEISEIIVVDDGSKDDTASLVGVMAAKTISLPVNMGKGKAMLEGLKHAREDIIAFVDADLGETAEEVRKVITAVLENRADLAVARWSETEGRKSGFGLVLELARWGIYNLTGHRLVSPLSGQRVIKRKYLVGLEDGFGVEVGMTVDCLRNGGQIKEIPVNMQHRKTGKDLSGFLHRGKQFVDVLKVLLKKNLQVVYGNRFCNYTASQHNFCWSCLWRRFRSCQCLYGTSGSKIYFTSGCGDYCYGSW